jgi:hypothetical protein
MPMHKGKATRNTTTEAGKSDLSIELFNGGFSNKKRAYCPFFITISKN